MRSYLCNVRECRSTTECMLKHIEYPVNRHFNLFAFEKTRNILFVIRAILSLNDIQHFAFQLWSDRQYKTYSTIDRLCAKSLDKTMHNEKCKVWTKTEYYQNCLNECEYMNWIKNLVGEHWTSLKLHLSL